MHSCIHSFIHSFIHSLINLFIHYFLFTHSFTHTFTPLSLIHIFSLIHWPVGGKLSCAWLGWREPSEMRLSHPGPNGLPSTQTPRSPHPKPKVTHPVFGCDASQLLGMQSLYPMTWRQPRRCRTYAKATIVHRTRTTDNRLINQGE